jgi:hypothetical protein
MPVGRRGKHARGISNGPIPPPPHTRQPRRLDMPESPDIKTETIAETENYMIYSAEEPDGETTWNVELGTVTVHFFREEWREFLQLVAQVKSKP